MTVYDDLTEVIHNIEQKAKTEGREEWRREILDIHRPIKRNTFSSSYDVCAECRDEYGKLTILYPCKTARVVQC